MHPLKRDLVLLVFLFCPLVGEGLQQRTGADASKNPSSLPDIQALLEQKHTLVRSLHVSYEVRAVPLASPESVKKFLAVEFLISEERSYAMKGVKEYYRFKRPSTADRIAPNTEPDYSTIPGGDAIKSTLDRERAIVERSDPGALKRLRAGPVRMNPELEVAFDGTVIRRKSFGGIGADIWKPENLPASGMWFEREFLWTSGLAAPNTIASTSYLNAFDLPGLLGRGEFKLQPGKETIDGQPCVVLVSAQNDRVWLDPSLGYAIRKRERFHPETGALKERWHNTEFREVLPGLWLPWSWHVDRCPSHLAPADVRGKPLLRYGSQVKTLELNNVPDSLFELKFDPGTSVMDTTLKPATKEGPEPVGYVQPADPSQLDEVIHKALGKTPPSSALSWWSLALMGAVSLLAVTALLLWMWRRRSSMPRGGV
jgi:hypothetical protein